MRKKQWHPSYWKSEHVWHSQRQKLKNKYSSNECSIPYFLPVLLKHFYLKMFSYDVWLGSTETSEASCGQMDVDEVKSISGRGCNTLFWEVNKFLERNDTRKVWACRKRSEETPNFVKLEARQSLSSRTTTPSTDWAEVVIWIQKKMYIFVLQPERFIHSSANKHNFKRCVPYSDKAMVVKWFGSRSLECLLWNAFILLEPQPHFTLLTIKASYHEYRRHLFGHTPRLGARFLHQMIDAESRIIAHMQ